MSVKDKKVRNTGGGVVTRVWSPTTQELEAGKELKASLGEVEFKTNLGHIRPYLPQALTVTVITNVILYRFEKYKILSVKMKQVSVWTEDKVVGGRDESGSKATKPRT